MPYKTSGGKQCVVIGCKNNQKKLYIWGQSECEIHAGQKREDCPCVQPFKLHCLPKDEEKKRSWLKAINRKSFNPTSKALVCSIHFIDGRPTRENPVPSLSMGYAMKMVTPARRPLVRRSLELNTPVKQEESCMDMEETFTASPFDLANCSPVQEDCHVWNDQCISVCCQSFPDLCKNVKKKPVLVDSSTQTIDVTALDHNYFYNKRTRDASVQHNTTEFSAESISSDMDCKFYTGLSLAVFTTLISTLSKFGRQLPYKMDIPDQILLVLIRLRIALTFRDIGRRFSISHQLASNIFNSWIDIMAKELSPCITWLPRETIRKSLPSSFQTSYPKTTCIIDCSEIFIQRPFSLKARAQTWSTYKSHNTAKFLIAIAPNGFIMYISPLYGGRASDNFITKNCGFLNNLLPGDEIMADRGFTISEELYARRVKLNIPAFMKGRSQLSEAETIESRRIAAQRIHVERAIMRLKSYRILNTTLGIKTLKKGNQTLQVIGVLCNLRQPLIKKDVLDID